MAVAVVLWAHAARLLTAELYVHTLAHVSHSASHPPNSQIPKVVARALRHCKLIAMTLLVHLIDQTVKALKVCISHHECCNFRLSNILTFGICLAQENFRALFDIKALFS